MAGSQTHTPERTAALEQEVLGSILLRGERYAQVATVLTEKHFADQRHQLIWRSLNELSLAGIPIDAISASQRLIDAGYGAQIGNGAFLTGLAADCIGHDPKHHVDKLHEAYVAREIRRVGAKLAESTGTEADADEAVRELMALQQGTVSYEHNIRDALRLAVDDLHAAQEAGDALRGIPTGLSKLDEHLGGLHDTDLIVVGARPAMGKTSFLLGLAHAALKDYSRAGGIITAEQPAMQIAQRHQASAGRVPLHKLRQGRIDQAESMRIMEATKHLAGMRYWMFDRPQPSIEEVVRVARKWHHQHQLRVLYLDYIQRIAARPTDPVERIEVVCSQLKTLARELCIPVVALAQVNRQVEARPNKRPMVSDLKGSGAIEQEADQILLLYRDEVYNEQTSDPGVAEINIGKNRHGYIGTVRTAWAGEFLRFMDFEPEYWQEGRS